MGPGPWGLKRDQGLGVLVEGTRGRCTVLGLGSEGRRARRADAPSGPESLANRRRGGGGGAVAGAHRPPRPSRPRRRRAARRQDAQTPDSADRVRDLPGRRVGESERRRWGRARGPRITPPPCGPRDRLRRRSGDLSLGGGARGGAGAGGVAGDALGPSTSPRRLARRPGSDTRTPRALHSEPPGVVRACPVPAAGERLRADARPGP